MAFATTGQQASALIRKSWTYQKRNIGANLTLCIAPLFFCIILAVIQVLVNTLIASNEDLSCGCRCTSCCYSWALKNAPGVFTFDGNSTIRVTDVQRFQRQWASQLADIPPGTITSNADGTLSIQVCSPLNNGPCSSSDGFSCRATDKNLCGIQFSTAFQSQFCAVPKASAWPALLQVPATRARAKPWGALRVGNITVPQVAVLATGANPGLVSSLGPGLVPGRLSSDPAVWEAVLSSIYAGNASDPKEGTIFWGEKLTQLGFQFGTSARSHDNVFIEAGFLPGNTLYLMVPASTCIAKNISTTRALCLAEFTRAYLAGVAQAQPLLRSLPPCSRDFVGNTSQLLSVNDLQVLCTETTVVPMADATDLEAKLYCGYFQAKCNSSNLYNNLYSTAFDFQAASLNALSFNAYYNDTLLIADNAGSNLRLPSLVTAAVSSWWSQVTGSTEVTNPLQLLGVMSMPKLKTKVTLDFSSLLGPLFFTWVVQLLLPTILQQLVYEKEKRLRMMMKMHGLEDTTYWSVTYLWFLVVYCIYILVFLVMGYITRLAIFTKTDLLIQIVTYFLHGNCMLAFCVLLSSLFINARTAIVVAFLYVFGSGLIGDLLFKTFMDQDKDWILFVQWVPAWSLYRCLYEMAAYAQLAVYRDERMGLQWSNLGDAGNGMPTAWIIFVVEWALFLVLGWYLEQVLGNGTGVRRHPLFFLDRIRGKNKAAATHQASGRASLELAAGAHGAHANHDAHPVMMLADGDPADVMAERLRVEALADYSNHPIVVRDIKKVFPAMDGGKPKVAVRTMTLGIQRGECFGLLGPNGAGKTTTINMLTGFLEPSGGGGVIEGLDIRTQMQDVYKLMGVCPQHDLLWEQLTGREHLHFFGRLKGLTGQVLEEAVDTALKGVNLFNVGDKPCGKYSGGMKRRLSVAISLIGSPKVVYMDEPSTGLDPASRRSLWDVVKQSKDGRSIILTTHSMEEAEMLCDRLGIFVNGRLVCIGNPREITSRFAGFLVFSLTVALDQVPQAKTMVLALSPSATLTYELGGTLKYELPSREVSLSKVFKVMAEAKQALQVVDWGVANATLEEVFIKLAKGAGAQTKD